MRANAPSSMRSLPQPASPAAPSQRERKERRNERLRCEPSACLLISRCGGSFPQGKLGAARFQSSNVGARHFFTQSDREARAERGSERGIVGRVYITNFGGRESRGKGGSVKSPSLWRAFPLHLSARAERWRPRRAQPRPPGCRKMHKIAGKSC